MFVGLVMTVSLNERFVSADASLVTPVEVDLSSPSHYSDTVLAGAIGAEPLEADSNGKRLYSTTRLTTTN